MKNLKLKSTAVAIMFMTMFLAACGGANWKTDDIEAIKKGDSMQQVLDRFGEPDRKRTDAKGNTVLEYRKASEMTENKLVRIGSLGMMGGKNSAAYFDVLTVNFGANKKVTSFKYEERISILSGR